MYELTRLTNPDISILRGAVGMRNAIIHDYLNLDWAKVEPVLAARKYHHVAGYIGEISSRLLQS